MTGAEAFDGRYGTRQRRLRLPTDGDSRGVASWAPTGSRSRARRTPTLQRRSGAWDAWPRSSPGAPACFAPNRRSRRARHSNAGRSPPEPAGNSHPFNPRPVYVLPARRRPPPPPDPKENRHDSADAARRAPITASCPAYDVEADVQQIRIVIEGMAGHVPTALMSRWTVESMPWSFATNSIAALGTPGRPGPPWPPPPCAPGRTIPTAAPGIEATHLAAQPARRQPADKARLAGTSIHMNIRSDIAQSSATGNLARRRLAE